MADLHGNKGLLMSILDEVSRPGEIIRDLLAGKYEGAARQAGQLGLNAVDAVLPGDWLPNDVARDQDYTSGRELIGANDDLLGKALGFGVDIATDPLTYIPGAQVAKAGAKAAELAGLGASKIVGKEAVEAAGRGIRSTFGAQRVSPKIAQMLADARAAGSTEAQAGMSAIKHSGLAKLKPGEDEIVGDLMDNLRWQDGKVTGKLSDTSKSALDRLMAHPGVNPENQGRIEQALKDVIEIGKNQKGRKGIFTTPEADTHVMVMPGGGVERFEKGGLSDEYLGRKWTGQSEEQAVNDVLWANRATQMGAPGATKALKLETPEQIAEYMAANPGAKFTRSATERMATRAQTQGTLATRADIGKGLLGHGFEYADPKWKAAAEDSIKAIADSGDPESAKVLMDAFSGMAPRGAVTSWLATANKAFKPYAVYGFGIPKFGAIVRNKVSGIWQALSNPESRAVVGGQAQRLGSDLAGAVVDSLGLNVSKDKLGSVLSDWEGALSTSGGSAERAIATMAAKHPDAAAAIKAGAIDGFVRSEDLISEMTRTGWKKKFTNIAEWPARMFRGVEDRMRLGMSLDLMAKGKTAEEAARITRDSLYDYSVASTHNRAARDIIPFFQFSAKAIPQQAKFLAEKPYVASALANAMSSGGDEQPLYPFMEGKLNIPLGGNQYVSGLGLPFEALGNIPNPSASLRDFGRQVEQNVVGSSQPMLKGAFATVAGEDPYFGTEFGSYDKIPVAGSAGAAGRLYNEATAFGLPFLTPADQLARTAGKATDDRRGFGVKALDMLTGANVVDVDPERALQQRLSEALAADPTVLQARTPINTSHDPETADLIKQLRDIKHRQKQARLAETLKGDVR